MYIPPAFHEPGIDRMHAVMRDHSFATVVTNADERSFASHLPLLLDEQRGPYGTLVGHVARANPQWTHLQGGGEALVIFQGPHAYVSPSWYEVERSVPTWNYVAVHAYGTGRLIEGTEAVLALLRRMAATYEAPHENPWSFDHIEEFVRRQLRGIAFEIEITGLEGKFKLGQNRSPSDRLSVARALAASPFEDDREIARLMEQVA